MSGRVRGLVEDAPDRAMWDRDCAPHIGHTWLDLPWYFAEAFFYRRLLEATGWTTNGADPFLPTKLDEERTLPTAHAPHDLAGLLHASLWGNRADLSYTAGRAHGERGTAADILHNDTSASVELLSSSSTVALLLDNAGAELAADLRLAAHLTSMGVKLTLWAKAHPTFVSDATAVDVRRTEALLALAPAHVVTHAYLTSAGFLFCEAMPADLVEELARFDAVIVKGDANYRRLVGDAPWPHHTPFADVVDFPAPVVALRTLKAEVAVGVDRIPSEPGWLTSGRYGVVQLG